MSKDKKQEFLNSDFVVSALINRAGLVYIGKVLYRFTDKQQEIVVDGDISKLGTTNQMVQTFNNPITRVTKQARVAVADFCEYSWKNKFSYDYERQIALDVKMKSNSYISSGYGSSTNYTVECQPTAFAVPHKKKHYADGSYEWVNYRTTNHLSSIWNFTVARSDNHQIQSAIDNYEYWNDWNFIDYGGTIITFSNVKTYFNGYANTLPDFIPTFQFGGGFYYTDGVPFDQKLPMQCL